MQHSGALMTVPMKIIYVALAMVCILIGIVGLILPMMPGLVFLAVAILLLARVSRRFDVWARRNPRLRTFRQRITAMSTVRMTDRFKLAGWMTLDALVKGAACAIDKGRTFMERSSGNRLG